MPDQTLQPDNLLQRPLAAMPRRAGWFLMVIVVAVYAAGLSADWSVGKDSGLFLNLARNVFRGQGYTLAGYPHMHVPPGFPMLLAGLMSLGATSFLALNVAMGLMGLATVGLVYLMLRQLVHRDWAILLTLAFALTHEMFQRSGEILSDVPFMLLVTAALWMYLRGLRADKPSASLWEVASVLLIASAWMRMVAFPLAAGAAVGLLISSWRTRRGRAAANVVLVAIGLAATLAFFIYYRSTHLDPIASSYPGTLDRLSRGSFIVNYVVGPMQHLYIASGQLSRLIIAQRMPLIVCTIVLVLPMIVAMAARMRRGEFVTPLATVVYVAALGVASEDPKTRYLLPVAPLLILLMIEGYIALVALAARLFRNSPQWRPQYHYVAPLALLTLALAMNLPLVGRTLVQKHQRDFFLNQQHGDWKGEILAGEFLKQRQPIDGCLLAPHPVAYLADAQVVMLSSGVLASKPSAAEISKLLHDLRVRYVVLDMHEVEPDLSRKKAPAAFNVELLAYCRGQSAPLFESGDIVVFQVE